MSITPSCRVEDWLRSTISLLSLRTLITLTDVSFHVIQCLDDLLSRELVRTDSGDDSDDDDDDDSDDDDDDSDDDDGSDDDDHDDDD